MLYGIEIYTRIYRRGKENEPPTWVWRELRPSQLSGAAYRFATRREAENHLKTYKQKFWDVTARIFEVHDDDRR